MKRHMMMVTGIMLPVLLICGCSTTRVKRVDIEESIDLSGRWNDTDSRLVADAMITDCLNEFWVRDFREQQKKRPVVIVGNVVNRSHEHINAQVFIKSLERQLIKSGKVKFVASPEERPDIRMEREDQHEGYTNPATVKAVGMETGADYMLIGSIHSIKDEYKGRYVILYQINLELISLTTNEKAWVGQEHLKKVVRRSRYSL